MSFFYVPRDLSISLFFITITGSSALPVHIGLLTRFLGCRCISLGYGDKGRNHSSHYSWLHPLYWLAAWCFVFRWLPRVPNAVFLVRFQKWMYVDAVKASALLSAAKIVAENIMTMISSVCKSLLIKRSGQWLFPVPVVFTHFWTSC